MANWAVLQESLIGLPVSRRAAHGIHFKNGSQFTALFSGKPCHYLDNGIYKPIDTALLSAGSGFYGCTHSDVQVHPDGRVKVNGTDYIQRTELPGSPTGSVSGDKIIREFSGGQQILRVTEDGFRQEIILDSIPSLKLTDARKLLATVYGSLPIKYIASQLTATDAARNTYTYTDTASFIAWLQSAQYPVTIDPDFSAEVTDGTLYSQNANYATAWSTAGNTIAGDLYTGQMLQAGNYYVYRSVTRFDTSSIDDGATISQVNIKMAVHYEQSATDFDVLIKKYAWDGVNLNDTVFDGILAADADDHIFCNTAGKTTNTYYTSGNLNTSWVSKTGSSYYGFLSSLDASATAPSGNDRFVFYDSSNATYRPILVITYATAAGNPWNYYAQQ